jgi:hypothetical protein
MKKSSMLAFVLASSLGMSLAAHAQSAPHRHDPVAALNLDDARAAQVHAILRASREKRMAAMKSIQAETDAQLSTVLSADEMAKLKAAMPRPPGAPRGSQDTGSPQ